jgi:hypothetical protein
MWYDSPQMSKNRFQRGALPAMAPGARRGSARAHRHLIGLFTVAAALLLVVNAAIVVVPGKHGAQATSRENVTGWVWSTFGGWLSMNDTNVGSGGGSYGVLVDSNRNMAGFAWSPNSGWVCFGASCNNPSCNQGASPVLTPTGAAPSASMNASWSALQGWAKFCNLGSDGWISMNCSNTAGECATSNYAVSFSTSTGNMAGWAWHGRTPNGWGWMDFSQVKMNVALAPTPEGPDPVRCRDGIDNDGNGLIDCYDLTCKGNKAANCPANERQDCGLIGQTVCCKNNVDDDFDGLRDCADSDCFGDPLCQPEICNNGIDDNGDGKFDCLDSMCTNQPGCELCTNGLDDNADGKVDCKDPQCLNFPACTPAWLQSKYGNVYAKLGVQGNPPPPGMANATYCITSKGTIVQATSETGCVEAMSTQDISLPANGTGYASSLGRLDVAGILSGRYGTVKTITSESGIETSPLGGKVYVYDGTSGCPSGGSFTLPAKTFYNATGQSGRGNGILVIKGCDLNITGNISYDVSGIGAGQYLRNLASFGVLVLAKYQSGSYLSGGNITIAPGVTNLVGTIYAERTISTGSNGSPRLDVPLQVYGAFVARQVNLQRQASTPSTPAESVVFDGRSVVNPPPGYQDVTKSLPSVSDKY